MNASYHHSRHSVTKSSFKSFRALVFSVSPAIPHLQTYLAFRRGGENAKNTKYEFKSTKIRGKVFE